jgi:alpha-glucosidase
MVTLARQDDGMGSDSHAWWQRGVVYQVYPRSFQDSNGDGIGDLTGIASRLDYLAWLGVDAIWLSPIFPSPMADFGYDVSNFVDIDPIFGTLADFDHLLDAAHRRGLKLILDFVPNHTSERHPWFEESRRDRTNPKRDWYVWRDPAPHGGPPNNWLSEFGGSAWEFDAATGQYYYHAYLKQQPDLNWRNPAVVAAMHDVLRFWFARGVDGFRIDVLHHLLEDEGLRDNPPNPAYVVGSTRPSRSLLPVHTVDQPGIQDLVAGLRAVADAYRERVLIGEIHLPVDRLVTYYGAAGSGGIQLPFNFGLITATWSAPALHTLVDTYEAALPRGAWPNWVVGNHDVARIATRVGPAGARLAMLLLLTLRGTPTLYYGDELGMTNVPIAPELVQDPFEKNVPGIGMGRDPCRTPMRWTPDGHGGFTTATPWLPVGEGLASNNVESATGDRHSMLSLTHRLLALRRAHPALAVGDYVGLQSDRSADAGVLGYMRMHGASRVLAFLNFATKPRRADLSAHLHGGRLIFSSDADRALAAVGETIDLAALEGVLIAAD